jgi:hypothetical protein
MAERIPQILKFVPHLNRRGVILVKRVYADENGPQLSAGVIRRIRVGWEVQLDYPEITASFMTLALAQAFCHGYSAAKGWTIPPDGTTSDDGAQDDAQDAQEAQGGAKLDAARLDRLEWLAERTKERLENLERLAHEPYDFEHLIRRLENLERLAHEHFVNTEDVKPSQWGR